MTPHPSAPPSDGASTLLVMQGISKTFPGVHALDDVNLDVRRGEIHALMGENGAGKSTLMKILAGVFPADPGGSIRIDGAPAIIDSPIAARRAGIAIIYQELALAPNLSVAENIHLGREPSRAGFVDRAAMRAAAQPLLERLGAGFGPDALVSDLSIAERQLVEIARALAARSKILVMDEPTTALSARETERLFVLMRTLRDSGMAIIYISHRMAEVYELADRVSVLRDGASIGTLEGEAIQPETLVRMMVGRDLSTFYKKDHSAAAALRGPVVLEASGIGDGRRVKNCSFVLHAGEVLALGGLVGAGRTELARLIYGAERRVSGEIRIGGKPVDSGSPKEAIEAGIVYLTEDRKGDGLFLDMPIRENITMGVIGRDARLGVLDRRRARDRAAAAIRALTIRARDADVEAGALSGGNQQKVLLSRLLELSPKALILDEPTRGVDIGAKSEIYRVIDDLAKAGVGVLMISSEMPEIVGVADRVLVMREGEIVGELVGPAIAQDAIVALASGAERPLS